MFVTLVGVLDSAPVGLSLYGRQQRDGSSVVSGAMWRSYSWSRRGRVPYPRPISTEVSLQVLRYGAET